MEEPQVVSFDAPDDEGAAGDELARVVHDLGIEAPMVVSSDHAGLLSDALTNASRVAAPSGANQHWSSELGSRAIASGHDAVIAIGGGRCLDVAKLAAARAGVIVVAVPTQLSHDGICSPVAVVPNSQGVSESVGAIAPRAVFISIPTLLNAPAASVAAGIGDLLANPLALRDWALAAERNLETTDPRAWDLSVESFQLIKPHLDADPRASAGNPEFLRQLADALVLSGTAMIWAGSSRPASGGEHEISHAIDALHGGRAMHGAQVAFGCIVSVALYGEDTAAFRDQLVRIGLPQHPGDLGLTEEQMVELFLYAPDTRPGRFTIIEHANLDEDSARSLVRRIWGRV